MKKAFLVFCSVLLFWWFSPVAHAFEKKQVPDPIVEAKIAEILKKMTLEEKAGQMLNIGLPTLLKGAYWSPRDTAVFDPVKFKKFIQDVAVGSIHNTPGYLADADTWHRIVKTIQDSAMLKTRLGIPVLYGIDNIHGANYIKGSVLFPHQIALAATWNRRLCERSAEITSYESRAASLPWNFNPNLDIAPNPLWGRISESFGEDPYLVSEMGAAYTRGSHGTSLKKTAQTAVCLKHFIGYGAGKNGKDRANASIPENRLRQYFLPPFEKAIATGAKGIMISSNAVNGIPCHINKRYITDLLKGELQFQGVVVSDFSDVEFLVNAHHSAKNLKEATKMAVNAGLDLLMNPYDAKVVNHLVELVRDKEISMARIDDAVSRILRLKFELNLFENPYQDPEDYPDFGSEKHIEENYKMAGEAITLLKNNAKTLPLTPDQKVLVTGYAAHTINVLNGAWSRTFLGRDTRYNDPTKLTILEAIQKQVGSENVRYAAGTDYTNDLNISEAVKLAKEVDCIVVCLGEIPATEKPSDIDELELPKVQQDLVEKLAASQKPIVLVLVQGRPRIIREIEPLTEAIVMAYLPGQEGGRAVSDVLYGAINPSGKLPYTYPKYSGNALPYYHKKADIRDIHWGYEGFDPQYEFGHGLSYASFAYSAVQTDKDTLSSSETLRLQVAVENTGSRTGKEVVQVYLKDLVATVSPDVKKLVRFKKIELEPGEKKTVSFQLRAKDFSFIGMDDKWVAEPGDFELFVGNTLSKNLVKKIYFTP